MGDRLAIVMTHTGRNRDVMEQNYASFQRHNPDATILLVESSPAWAEELKKIHPVMYEMVIRSFWEHKGLWRNCDLILMAEALKHPGKFDKWLYVEWDVYCNVPVRTFFDRQWTYDVVTTECATPLSHPGCCWFSEIYRLPKHLTPLACSLTPLAVTLFSDAALQAITVEFLRYPFSIFCEIRLATLATYTGYCPVSSLYCQYVGWTEKPQLALHNIERAIYHPIKHLL